MPSHFKRKFEDFDPNASDPDDDDYDAKAERAARPKPSKNQPKKRSKRSRRSGYATDGSEDPSDDDVSEEDYEDVEEAPEEEEDVEINERTGRPKRRATKKTTTYTESTDDDEPIIEASEPEEKPRKRLTVKLKVNTPAPTPGPGRTSRAGSVTRSRRGLSSEPLSAGTRRSSRLHHDEHDPIIALSGSGRHAEIIESGTKSPESKPIRATRGSKGLKAPSTIVEAEDEASSIPTKGEPGDNIPEPETTISTHPQTGRKSQRGPSEDSGARDPDELVVLPKTDTQNATQGDSDVQMLEDTPMAGLMPETDVDVDAEADDDGDDDDDDDEEPISKGGRTRGGRVSGEPPIVIAKAALASKEGTVMDDISFQQASRPARSKRPSQEAKKQRKTGGQDDSDFEVPDEEGDEDMSSNSEVSDASPRKGSQRNDEEDYESSNTRRSGRLAKGASKASDSVLPEEEELAEELEELKAGDRPRRAPRTEEIIYDSRPHLRRRKRDVDYRIVKPDLNPFPEFAEEAPSASPSRRSRGTGGGTWQRNLFSTYGPFGGAGGPQPVFSNRGFGATGGVESDSSDDERMQRPGGLGGTVGMTPTSVAPPGLLAAPQSHNMVDPLQGPSGTPANLGKIKSRQALADADPLGVDQNVSFDKVGGLEDHINQLKEMVSLPLLYPEIFQRFKVTPPRGVLFHGPPGTGKTLLARALAASCSSEGRKITFYMRKGADALSKWVGEAERQLRLLFEEARTNQPSIIFFDEIDGLAPVRSSKQEQIHASIVSTLLALMDGMDGRGQVIVIGATNRPDSIDPALRRPGRFDREFYFPLPSTKARRAIIDIHTQGWEPGLSDAFKDDLAALTKGYGGADLRALCTEAALNAVQRRYPQIYKSNEKLLIDPTSIDITAKDFMISVKKIVPSSERSASSGAAALAPHIEPLLRDQFMEIKNIIAEILPERKKATALEEAQYEDYKDPDGGFGRERTQQEFEISRVFRPRLLVRGLPGMGQQYIAAALLHHFEGLHVQAFDLPTLLSDSTRSPEAAVVQLFAEVKRHKPGVIYLPSVDVWYRTVGPTVVSTFLGLLRSIPATEPVLLLGVLESDPDLIDRAMLKDLFGFSKGNQYELDRPRKESRREFFKNVVSYIRKSPNEFPHPGARKMRKLEILPVAPAPPPRQPTKEELKSQLKRDMLVLNFLKIKIQPIMDQIKLKYKKFRTPIIDHSQIVYLFQEEDPNYVVPDIPQGARPFEKAFDKHGYEGLLEKATGKFYYNRDIGMIEERLSNGFYKRPKDFLTEIRFLWKDARTAGDKDRQLKASEMVANVEVDVAAIEADPFLADCENVYLRFEQRDKEKAAAVVKAGGPVLEAVKPIVTEPGAAPPSVIPTHPASGDIGGVTAGPVSGLTTHADAPRGQPSPLPITPLRPSHPSSLSNGFVMDPMRQRDLSGHIPQSNGSSIPSGGDGDVDMTDRDSCPPTHPMGQQSGPFYDTQFSQQTPSSRPPWSLPPRERSGLSNWEPNPSRTTTQRSQKSILTTMPPGSQIEDFGNDASATTSGQKASDQSARSSLPFNTQSSNGIPSSGRKEEPDFSAYPARSHGDSQLPSTQDGSVPSGSQTQSQPQSQPPVPHFNAPSKQATPNSILSILNDPSPTPILDNSYIDSLHEEFADRTSGCSVEQLEQINAALMDEIWKTKDEWNRNFVGERAQKIFNDVIEDVEEMQAILPASLNTS
ncbi:hypothetical protein FGG08_004649 [Glutinoglossum americanum]|uniref:AAA+ ATPase domain-containing protein n=1 Tax=Glutinoglossum americanum TaxID=1670608 RepID=A0A9P8HZU6_9PEZI|nr:hypothetical protein FGG08_004649 [Glutinoglossum americanum]